jgi:BirA family transcriptional regulator, biotin operon repressor / biotin---[acetyl-CoA-carboxylase] ligase
MRLETLFIGHPIEMLEQVDSTNTVALEMLRKSPPPEGYIVWGKNQLAGRGQRGSRWSSEPGANLTFSIILHPKFLPISSQFQLTKAIALGIADAVSHTIHNSGEVRIKWPNDIYVNNCKIAGILIENVLEQSVFKYSVTGIGLNINQTKFDPSIPNPASLKSITGNDFDTEECLYNVCSFIERRYLDLRAGNYGKIDEAYFNLLYRRGTERKFSFRGDVITATIEGVTEEGALMLRKENPNNSYENLVVTDSKQLLFL